MQTHNQNTERVVNNGNSVHGIAPAKHRTQLYTTNRNWILNGGDGRNKRSTKVALSGLCL